jgi:hypothetical protein
MPFALRLMPLLYRLLRGKGILMIRAEDQPKKPGSRLILVLGQHLVSFWAKPQTKVIGLGKAQRLIMSRIS